MTMKKALLVGVFLVLLAAGGIAAWLLLRTTEPSQEVPTDPFGGIEQPSIGEVPEGATRELRTVDGATLVVADFTYNREPVAGADGEIYFDLVHTEPVYSPSETPYQIQFSEMESEFTVLLIQEPLGASRIAAESYLRTLMGATDAELCALKIVVAVPYDLNAYYSRYPNLGLSFCPGSVTLP